MHFRQTEVDVGRKLGLNRLLRLRGLQKKKEKEVNSNFSEMLERRQRKKKNHTVVSAAMKDLMSGLSTKRVMKLSRYSSLGGSLVKFANHSRVLPMSVRALVDCGLGATIEQG